MKSAKDEIFARIREAAGIAPESRAEEYAAIERTYRQRGGLDPDERLSLFTDRLIDYDAVVYRCTEAEAAATVLKAMTARGKGSLIIPPDLHRDWLPPAVQFIPDADLPYTELDASEGALTGCTAAIAMTGSILLGHGPNEGRRALTLIPDYHLCIVYAGQVVETVPEGIRQMSGCATVTTISGPSATADIEMTRIKGVHGPRSFDVILIVNP